MAPAKESKVYTKEDLCLIEEKASPCGIVIFGASGDLASRKLLPSLSFLYSQKRLPSSFYVLGVARTKMSDQEFRDKISGSLPKDSTKKQREEFLSRCYYLPGSYREEAFFGELKKKLEELDKAHKLQDRHLFYLSTPPSLYTSIIENLDKAGLTPSNPEDKNKWKRVIIEKPFGRSYESAKELNTSIRKSLREKQIYRIDHYLGKETVQNIMMFRFANVLFEPVWNSNYIDHVQITASEQLGIEHRAGYYEQSGVLRDMFQNHLLQLLALITMEVPSSMKSDAVRDRKVDIFRAIKVMNESEVERNTVLAQYDKGSINGDSVRSYLTEKDVNPKSKTPTYAAVKFEIDNWRWHGVPFYIRSGKRLKERLVEIAIRFKNVPASVFQPLTPDQLNANVLKFRIQPDEGILLQFEAKHPGPKLCIGTVTMDFQYQEAFKTPPPESYVRLFHDAMIGDQTLFSRSDGVEQCWKIMDPILNFWESKKAPALSKYGSGSWGPKEADTLLNQSGRNWL